MSSLEVGDDFAVSWCNQAAIDLIGLSPIGITANERLVKMDLENSKKFLKQRMAILSNEVSMGYSEACFIISSGERRLAQIQFSSKRSDCHQKKVIMSFLLDVTDYRRSERLLFDLFKNQINSTNEPTLVVF